MRQQRHWTPNYLGTHNIKLLIPPWYPQPDSTPSNFHKMLSRIFYPNLIACCACIPVGQHAKYVSLSATMAENSHGMKPTLPNHHHFPYQLHEPSKFQAAMGSCAKAVPEAYSLAPDSIRAAQLAKALSRTLHHASHSFQRNSVCVATSGPWHVCGGSRYLTDIHSLYSSLRSPY